MLLLTAVALAQDPGELPLPPAIQDRGEITFTRLLVRDDGGGVFAPDDQVVRQLALDELRDRGLPVPAGDSVLFGDGAAPRADWQLGGTLIDLACVARTCEAAVEWQLFHAPSGAVQYVVTTRGTAPGTDPSDAAFAAVRASLGSMLDRPTLQGVLAGDPLTEKIVDPPDPPGALVAAATADEPVGAAVEPEVETWGRAAPPAGRGRMVAGTVTGSVGATLVFLSWADFELSRFNGLTPARFRGEQVVNAVGWAGVLAGTGVAVSGILKMERASGSPPTEAP